MQMQCSTKLQSMDTFSVQFYQNSPSSERLDSLARSSSLTYLHSWELEKIQIHSQSEYDMHRDNHRNVVESYTHLTMWRNTWREITYSQTECPPPTPAAKTEALKECVSQCFDCRANQPLGVWLCVWATKAHNNKKRQRLCTVDRLSHQVLRDTSDW